MRYGIECEVPAIGPLAYEVLLVFGATIEHIQKPVIAAYQSLSP